MSSRNALLVLSICSGCGACLAQAASSQQVSREAFRHPPFVYRPIATLSDHGVSVEVLEQEKTAFDARGYGSVLFSPSPHLSTGQHTQGPSTEMPPSPNGAPATGNMPARRPMALQYSYPAEASQWLPKALPGEAGIGSYMVKPKPGSAAAAFADFNDKADPSLGYMSDAYFARIRQLLTFARQNGRYATYYDEVGFPSGMADHTTPAKYVRKILSRSTAPVAAGTEYKASLPDDGTLVSVIAVETSAAKRIDLSAEVKEGQLAWTAPPGDWQVQTFTLVPGKSSGRSVDYNGAVDYMDPGAVNWFIGQSYEPMAQHLSEFFGNTLNMTFFDDVGIYSDDKTWNVAVSERFKQRTGRDAGPYYPALWEDIGPDTEAARANLFAARAGLLGEGLPKLVTEWDDRHGLQASGHTPGNYDLQPVDMNGDPFKFYRYENIPMVDVIFGHGFGRNGFKLISSAADEQDKPIVAAETFSSGGDVMGYRRLIELYVRGINRFVTSAFPRAEPVGSPTDFSEWAGRSSMLLQGGMHVADIAILYPIDSLEAYYSFAAKENRATIPAGDFVSQDTDYQAIGEMLLDQTHRDFTFLHPETLSSDKVSVTPKALVLQNTVNRERFQVLVLPGAKVLSVAALRKVKAFYDAGGVVVATSLLPSKSAEFGEDAQVRSLVQSIFGIDSTQPMPEGVSPVHGNAKGGKAVFLRLPSAQLLDSTLDSLGVTRDVAFSGNPQPSSGNGCFSYIHKLKDGQAVYYFGNSSDTPITTQVELRGVLHPELWDPRTGGVTSIAGVEHVLHKGVAYTRVPLQLPQVAGLFFVSPAPK